MDPISNKKDFEDLTTNLRDLAYSYIEKYNPSKQQVKTYLLKKYLKKFQGSKSKKDSPRRFANLSVPSATIREFVEYNAADEPP